MSSNEKANQEASKKVLVEFRCILKNILLLYRHGFF